ncbi:hypothetical protein K437DRAFT_42405 [Tilletiaria anomala UBC 951]|uniref:Uncharacterized protein n=1 Tax=Tilletiaria anomala (strain ATCC 24038 / CBS 436.72 / UBC 951) TaxID=1037660 RepID=A0A066VAC3_TILAU|nr:uncharacterized protein K437DRAFT_42405 [Tilletiaria anomala UBC 951]KDN37238.1 hypothetical protein K437DRAFT_42405 [Tilletiaria anomala UBC 951]
MATLTREGRQSHPPVCTTPLQSVQLSGDGLTTSCVLNQKSNKSTLIAANGRKASTPKARRTVSSAEIVTLKGSSHLTQSKSGIAARRRTAELLRSTTQKSASPPEVDALPTPPARPPRLPTASLSQRHPRQAHIKETTFDSLQELLERAGYRETRVITPDQKRLAAELAARGRREEDEAIHALTAMEQRRQGSFSGRSAAEGAARGPIPGSWSASSAASSTSIWNWMGTGRATKQVEAEEAALMSPVGSAASWISSVTALWPPSADQPGGTTSSDWLVRFPHGDDDQAAIEAVAPIRIERPSPKRHLRKSKSTITHAAATERAESILPSIVLTSAAEGFSATITAQTTNDDGGAIRLSPSLATSKRPLLRKRRSKNDLWQASLALRDASGTACSSKSLLSRSIVQVGIGSAEMASTTLSARLLSGAPIQRRSSIDAFGQAQPTMRESMSVAADISSGEASPEGWRNSLSSLSRASGQSLDPPVQEAAVPALLVSAPAQPLLSSEVAVAPRNAGCLRPASLRKAYSIEVLRAALQGDSPGSRIASTSTAQAQAHASTSGLTPSSSAGSITPAAMAAPVLTITTPSGTDSPQTLPLVGAEFEPLSLEHSRSVMSHISDVLDAAGGDTPLPAAERRFSSSATRQKARRSPAARPAQDAASISSQGSVLAEQTNTVLDSSKRTRRALVGTPDSPFSKSSQPHKAVRTSSVAEPVKLGMKGQATPPRRTRHSSNESPTSVVAQSRSLRRTGVSLALRDHVAHAALPALASPTKRPLKR